MPTVSPLVQITLALTGLPKENVAKRYISMHSNESKKCKDVSAKFFYNFGQFLLTLIGCSDKQVLKRAFKSYALNTAKDVAAGQGLHLTHKQLKEIKKAIPKQKININDALKGFVALNKIAVTIPKKDLDVILKDAKEASAALKKGNLTPMGQFVQDFGKYATEHLKIDPQLILGGAKIGQT